MLDAYGLEIRKSEADGAHHLQDGFRGVAFCLMYLQVVHAMDLCRAISLGDRALELVQSLSADDEVLDVVGDGTVLGNCV